MASDIIATALQKGSAMTLDDVQDIAVELAFMPLDEAHEARPWIAEGLWLIVADPSYSGPLTLADIDV